MPDETFICTFKIANPAFSSGRSAYTLDANNIDEVSAGYRVYMLTSSAIGGTPTIVPYTLVETPTLSMTGNAQYVIGAIKVSGTRPDNSIVAVYSGGTVAGQITYETE